ncbi:MAG: chemotaxis protein CheW [Clostridia bacterium]|nr:chemotaxis protein CheW [Clostridia bacterium]
MAIQQNKYLSFVLENEIYGIHILRVKEIIGMMTITHVPRMPEFVKGVINLRGKIIPVIDLRIKFSIPGSVYSDRTCIIVVEMESENGKRVNGLVVDSVCEVLAIAEENIEAPPACGDGAEQEILTGIGKVKDKVIMLLDTDKILTTNEIKAINKI